MTNYRIMFLDGLAVFAAITVTLLLRRHKRQHQLPLPPGPRRLPVVGNLFQVPKLRLWERASDWAKIYGDLIYLEVAGTPMLIVNSHDIAVDLLSKRSANYSSRPQLLIQHLCGWAWVTSMIPYGDSLRKQRAILHRFFQFPEVLNYKELQERECHLFLRRLVDSPENYDRHIRRLPASILGLNTYGHEVKDDNDRYLELGEESAEMTIEAVNYLYLDFLPWMRFLPAWFPGGSFQKFVEESRKLSTLFRNEIYALNKNKRLNGTAKESMATIFMDENQDSNGLITDEGDFMDAAATVFLGGSDTTITTLMNFVLAMLKYPEVQRRAQEEIDVVVGNDRLPTFKDRAQLPYIRALCLELLRWQAILPLGFIHTAAEEDVYHGYRIPAGTMVIPNVWAISRNEDIYPKPLDFIPERWLPGGSSLNSFRPDEYVFGYGRRICPGQVWAEHMIFIAVVSILAAFKIEKALDSDGEPIPPNENHKPAAIRLLGPSECMIAPRSEKIASMIRDCAGILS